METKRLLVTPTRVVATGVEQETSNRVLRHFAKHRGIASLLKARKQSMVWHI